MTLRRRHGFSLVEILVVLVILLIGILSIIRIFPLGLIGLGNTRDYTIAQLMARRELDSLASQADDLPRQILGVKYLYVNQGAGWQLLLQSDPDTNPKDLSAGGNILESGDIEITNPGGGSSFIPWRYYNDVNRVRRIVGEGGKIPAPRPVGSDFGGLRILRFGPIVNDVNLLLVYGQDMEGNGVQDTVAGDPRRNPQPWSYTYDNEIPQLWLPGTANRAIRYKVNFSYWLNVSGSVQRVDIIDKVLTVTPTPAGGDPTQRLYDATTGEVSPFDLQLIAGPPVGWIELDPDSISVNRLFDPVAVFDPLYPYEYKVLNPNLGAILFNPAGYNFQERRNRARRPLTAEINYDVYNWHVLRDEFRADRGRSPIHKLTLSRIKAIGDEMSDRRRYPGLEIPVPAGGGNVDANRDIIVLDLDTGGVVSPHVDVTNANTALSYKVDYLRGVIAFGSPQLPAPGGPNDLGQGITIILPDNQTVLTGVNPAGRNFRIFYQAHNDWALQVIKAPQRILVTYGLPIGIAQCYVGGSNSSIGGGATRLYFPWADLGDKVNVREIWYRDTNGNLLALRDQDFLVRPPIATDPVGLPYIDIQEADINAVTFDFATYGYAIRGVSGSSVRARVVWNTTDKEDVAGDAALSIQQRMDLHEAWTRGWRVVDIESYLTRRDKN